LSITKTAHGGKKAQPTAAPEISPPLKNIWFALRATKEKTALARRNSDFFPILVRKAGIEPARLLVKGF
jgi:hypothetical protein